MVLVLDQSGSMLDPSGVGAMTREQVLRFSAGICRRLRAGAQRRRHGHLRPGRARPAGRRSPARSGPRRPVRLRAQQCPHGAVVLRGQPGRVSPPSATGSSAGHNVLAAVSGYDKKAVVVFTDGFETAAQYIADVTALIDDEVFAVGLGTANELNPARSQRHLRRPRRIPAADRRARRQRHVQAREVLPADPGRRQQRGRRRRPRRVRRTGPEGHGPVRPQRGGHLRRRDRAPPVPGCARRGRRDPAGRPDRRGEREASPPSPGWSGRT